MSHHSLHATTFDPDDDDDEFRIFVHQQLGSKFDPRTTKILCDLVVNPLSYDEDDEDNLPIKEFEMFRSTLKESPSDYPSTFNGMVKFFNRVHDKFQRGFAESRSSSSSPTPQASAPVPQRGVLPPAPAPVPQRGVPPPAPAPVPQRGVPPPAPAPAPAFFDLRRQQIPTQIELIGQAHYVAPESDSEESMESESDDNEDVNMRSYQCRHIYNHDSADGRKKGGDVCGRLYHSGAYLCKQCGCCNGLHLMAGASVKKRHPRHCSCMSRRRCGGNGGRMGNGLPCKKKVEGCGRCMRHRSTKTLVRVRVRMGRGGKPRGGARPDGPPLD